MTRSRCRIGITRCRSIAYCHGLSPARQQLEFPLPGRTRSPDQRRDATLVRARSLFDHLPAFANTKFFHDNDLDTSFGGGKVAAPMHHARTQAIDRAARGHTPRASPRHDRRPAAAARMARIARPGWATSTSRPATPSSGSTTPTSTVSGIAGWCSGMDGQPGR